MARSWRDRGEIVARVNEARPPRARVHVPRCHALRARSSATAPPATRPHGAYTSPRRCQAIDPNGRRPLHLSLDIDAVDPHVAPGTGTCARGGLGYREIHYVCEELAETQRLVSMDLVEVRREYTVNATVTERSRVDGPGRGAP